MLWLAITGIHHNRQVRSFNRDAKQMRADQSMKTTIIILACSLVACLAFGQASVSDNTSGPRTLVNAGPYKAGTVASFTGRTITVSSSQLTHPRKFVVADNVLFQKLGGSAVSPDSIRPGTRVRLEFGPEGRVDRITLLDLR